MTPFGVLGGSQLSSNALPCSLCSTVKLRSPVGEASRVLMPTHGLDPRPEGFQNTTTQCSDPVAVGDFIYL